MGTSKGKMKIQGILSKSFTSQNDLRKGDPLSTILFNLALEYVTRRITSNPDHNIYNRLYQHLAYADGLCLTARSPSSLSTAFGEYERAASEIRLLVNGNQISYLHIRRQKHF
jgi:hypothetical protein